jgi:hypothetical protein
MYLTMLLLYVFAEFSVRFNSMAQHVLLNFPVVCFVELHVVCMDINFRNA